MHSCFVSAKDFVRKLMDSNPDKRYTCIQALEDPWYNYVSFLHDFKQANCFRVIFQSLACLNTDPYPKMQIITPV